MTKIRTALVGSYVQPEWLIDREALRNRLPARIITGDMWRVAPDLLHEAMDDAVLRKMPVLISSPMVKYVVKAILHLLPMPRTVSIGKKWKL
jgi:hypothetical protein